MAIKHGLWKVFEVGDYFPTKLEEGVHVVKTEDEYDENDRRLVTLNSKAILMLQSALNQKEYFQICNLSSSREMWKASEIAHEGTMGIKEIESTL